MAQPMNYSSTQVDGYYTHHQGALVVGTAGGHGIELNVPQSTTAAQVPNVMPAGDDANIGIKFLAKGTGQINVGDSSNAVFLGSTAAQSGAASMSGTVLSSAIVSAQIKGIFQSSFTAQFAGLSSNVVNDVTLSTADTHAIAGDLISIQARVTEANGSSNLIAFCGWRCSTVGTSNITLQLANISSTTTSTGRITGIITYLDLT